MNIKSLSALGGLLLLATTYSLAATAEFPDYGFQIDTLSAPLKPEPIQTLMMFLPAQGGFSPNVNVIIQPFTGTFVNYLTTTREQVGAAGWKIVAEQSTSPEEWAAEYTGLLQERAMHWYARVVHKNSRIYLVTATCPEEGWAETAARLKNCVDSFTVK